MTDKDQVDSPRGPTPHQVMSNGMLLAMNTEQRLDTIAGLTREQRSKLANIALLGAGYNEDKASDKALSPKQYTHFMTKAAHLRALAKLLMSCQIGD